MRSQVNTEADGFQRRFNAALARLVAPPAPGRWIVAFSGGLDSTLLLDALWRAETEAPITALHVDHGLHEDSARWSEHCAAHAAALGVEFQTHQVGLDRGTGHSLEALARQARYAVFADVLQPQQMLLTAHHADDQLETVLLRILRGTGVRGLSAIRALSPLGHGLLGRPLLEFTQAEIRAEASRRRLGWLEDPSNQDWRFDRNYLRHSCLPPVLERWPRAGLLAVRMARQMTEAEAVLADVARSDLADSPDPDRIPLAVLAGLSGPRRNNALRHAVHAAGLPAPTAAQFAELCQLLSAREDAQAVVCWPGAELRVYRQHLYLLRPLRVADRTDGRVAAATRLQMAHGELSLVPTADYGIPDRWARAGLSVRFRQGGERFQPYRSGCRKSLKHWFQEAGVVPWMRNAVPLLYRDEQLVAVGDLALADDLPQSAADAPFWRPLWSDHPRLR